MQAQKLISLFSHVILLVLVMFIQFSRTTQLDQYKPEIVMPTDKDHTPTEPISDDGSGGSEGKNGKIWAVLVAGSNGYGNYRHQADVCHAYQLLRKGGIKDENIVVFMYDDIAMHELNPRRGIIINHPQGQDVYAGVPKDYTGKNVTVKNFYAVLLGNKTAVKSGSGKVVNSKPNDRIFVYYSDHGGPGVLGMPNGPFLYAKDFIDVLKRKHASGSYKEMLIYVEACESGSIFQGIMPKDLNIYVTTASNAQESSFGTYCPGMDPAPPAEYITCLGDLYSVAWMEDSETHNLKEETVEQQYNTVKARTSNKNMNYTFGSHVMEYGDQGLKPQKLYLFQGFDPADIDRPPKNGSETHMNIINQRDAELLFLWQLYKRYEDVPEMKLQITKQISETMRHRKHLDGSVALIGTLLFGPDRGSTILQAIRQQYLPLVDDWECLKSMVRVFEEHCRPLTQYGMKHMRSFANICNAGVSRSAMEKASAAACGSHNFGMWQPSLRRFSA